MEVAVSKAKKPDADLPVLDRDFIETKVLEALDRAKESVKLTDRKKAQAEATLLQGLLDASR